MKKLFLAAGALALLLPLGGCFGIDGTGSGLTLSQAVQLVTAIPCDVALGAQAATGVEVTPVNGAPIAGNSAQQLTQTIFVASTAACALAHGIAAAAVTVPATALSTVTAPVIAPAAQ